MGICLGMQLLFEYSDEFGRTDGLSFIKGGVKKMPIQKGSGERLPHVSWNEIHAPSDKRWANTVLNNISENENVYFVHSYVCVPDEKSTILATTKYGGVEFCSAVQVDNVTGLQFHPEKSAEKGLQIIKNFIQ
jgi:glutamine amidotransferase